MIAQTWLHNDLQEKILKLSYKRKQRHLKNEKAS